MYDLVKKEQEIIEFWEKNKIFQKSVRDEKSPEFVFYEGPPTANGMPGIHHVEARAFKDIICRYKNMKGFRVLRKAGWDTHGLPVEIQVEKELNLKDKKGIEDYGILKFNEKCRESVWQYKKNWEEVTKRIGYWLDMENPYITYENEYIESVWWILKQVWDKNLLFQDYKVTPFCPRCGTTLSSHELAQGYQKIKEPSVYLKFELVDRPKNYLLVWTTTPWTLPGNVAIAVNPDFTYVKAKVGDESYILAKQRIQVLESEKYEIVEESPGKDLIGLKYKSLYEIKDAAEQGQKAYEVLPADFVTLEEGTGLVHIAPAFGEDDYQLIKSQRQKFSFLITVDKRGKMNTPGYQWDKMFVKEADVLIIKDLKQRNVLFKQELYEHDYPFCWRCDTPLIYYAQSSWFIKMTALRNKLLENNKKINWIPPHLKDGRFGEWLEEIKDWNLSRERYWGTPLPIWRCRKCEHRECIGSFDELAKKTGRDLGKNFDPHRPGIDEVIWVCPDCGGEMKRVTEVIDCWFDSGAMPFAQWHYPFEHKEKIDDRKAFPADFICEGIDQTRGWFYSLLAISTFLDLGPSYKNVVVTGTVLDEKGQKMSKSKGNIVVPEQVIDKYGADCIRLYFYTINQVDQPKRFAIKDVEDVYRKVFSTLENCLAFYKMYAGRKKPSEINSKDLNNVLDKWIVSKLNMLMKGVSDNLDKYDIVAGARLFVPFVDDLSNWYIRRSRRRFQRPENEQEKTRAFGTLRYVLLETARIMAAFTPFISEHIYQTLKGKKDPESVHLCRYPENNEELIDMELEQDMEKIKEIASLALAQRAEKRIKVRQPLAELRIPKYKFQTELLDLIKEEVNVKEVIIDANLKEGEVKLDTEITAELKNEGEVGDIIRQIQRLKKELNVEPKNKVSLKYKGDKYLEELFKNNADLIKEKSSVAVLGQESAAKAEQGRIIKMGEKEITVFIKIE